MKKPLLLGLGAVAIVFAAGAGISSALFSEERVEQVSAEPGDTTLYYVGSQYTHAYLWKDGADPAVNNGDFPGEAMTYVSTNLYSITFDSSIGYDKVIFAKGDKSAQSDNLDIDYANPYYLDRLAVWRASNPIGFYLLGDHNSWSLANALSDWKMEHDLGSNSLTLYNKTFSADALGNKKMQAIYWDGNLDPDPEKAFVWYAGKDGAACNYGVAIPGDGNFWSNGDAGIYFGAAGSVTVDINVAFGSPSQNVYKIAKPCDLTVTVAGVPKLMASYPANFHEYTAVFENVSAGASVSFSYEVEANDSPSNNLRSGKILTGGDEIVITVNKGESIAWASGYDTGIASELKLFCERLLAYTNDGGVCADPSGTKVDETITWTYFSNWYSAPSFTDYRAAFKSAVASARLGDDVVYSSVLDEAACRYVYLAQKYSLPAFGDIELPSAKMVSHYVAEKTNVPVIATVFGITVFLASLGGLLFIRRRKED